MEKLYNGIVLDGEWPPRYDLEKDREEIKVPYLENPPETINIDIGRQLFVDDFLIENTNLEKVYHEAQKFSENPVLRAESALEKAENFSLPSAAPKGGGVWYDEERKKFRMWYEAGWLHSLAYAESDDGIHWERPELENSDIPKNNRLIPYIRHDSSTVWIDKESKTEKYKMFLRSPNGMCPGMVATSEDGIYWENFTDTNCMGDRSTIFYNPFRKKWVYSIRSLIQEDRGRNYIECDNLLEGARWEEGKDVKWMRTDKFDIGDPMYPGFIPQLYNLDAVAYESIMLGMFQIYLGPENCDAEKVGIPKLTELIPMYSRDGFHFSRPSRKAFIKASRKKGEWDRGYVQSTGGVCVIVGDELWFYYSGCMGDENNTIPYWSMNGMYSNIQTGIAKLRRDGFVSLHTENEGEILTRQIEFSHGSHLFVNANGTVNAEIRTAEGEVINGFSFEDCGGFSGNSTKAELIFKGDINMLCNKKIRIAFKVKKGDLYSFWTSDTEKGESGGMMAAGIKEN